MYDDSKIGSFFTIYKFEHSMCFEGKNRFFYVCLGCGLFDWR